MLHVNLQNLFLTVSSVKADASLNELEFNLKSADDSINLKIKSIFVCHFITGMYFINVLCNNLMPSCMSSFFYLPSTHR